MLPSSTTANDMTKVQYAIQSNKKDRMSPSRYTANLFRVRPDPRRFDDLAMSIARAAAHMPRLAYMNFEFERPLLYDDHEFRHPLAYEGWAFYFRANKETQMGLEYYREKRFRSSVLGPALNERPCTEWIFQVSYDELEWQEPREAQELWRQKHYVKDFDLVTKGKVVGKNVPTWERRRRGMVVQTAKRTWRPREICS
ncbi:hypothetical protein P154DRAFT_117535 [Amniculicola lignicola CBS 123094]|uniref:Uncharacterized protein n=1 Tax=Amniculicola lignicola CBS 123094 TaxID=1392246 RepID=A0A6A5X333_9PLEO|nr:hypothetical protein P154DRAFT_117535 [Amniculicola lignicola CBS 123094]